MNFGQDFINAISQAMENSVAFTVTFNGFQALGIAFISFTFIKTIIEGANNPNGDSVFNLGSIINSLAYIIIIISSGWILSTVEGFYQQIEASFNIEPSTMNLNSLIPEQNPYELEESEQSILGMGDFLWQIPDVIMGSMLYVSAYILIVLGYVLDVLVYGLFLVERKFLILILTMVFPLIVGLSCLPGQSGLLIKWIKIYIATSLLAIVFMGITTFINSFTEGLLDLTHSEIETDIQGTFLIDSIRSITVVTFSVILKFKLFSRSTSFTYQIFS